MTLRNLDEKRTPQRVWAEKLRLLPPELARTAVMSRQITEEQRFLKSLKFDEVRLQRLVAKRQRSFLGGRESRVRKIDTDEVHL